MGKAQYQERMQSISDNEIKNILRQRDHYDAEAAEAAIDEAIQRGIISSKNDLNKTEFDVEPIGRRKLFPTPPSTKKAETTLHSLTQILYGVSAIPLILAILKFAERNYLMVVIAIVMSVGLALITKQIREKRDATASKLLLLLNPIIWALLIQNLIGLGTQNTMDFVVALVLAFVVYYLTMATYKTISYLKSE